MEREHALKIFKELYDGPRGGHCLVDAISHKILLFGYYWTNLFKDPHAYEKKCDVCQISGGKLSKEARPP